MQRGGAQAKGRQQQHAVGNALGAREQHSAACGGEGRNIEKVSGKHYFLL
jgi:hypothetical protein